MRALTVHGHAHSNALLEAAQLALVAGDLVDDAATIVLTGVGRVEVLLNGPTKKPLEVDVDVRETVSDTDGEIRAQQKP